MSAHAEAIRNLAARLHSLADRLMGPIPPESPPNLPPCPDSTLSRLNDRQLDIREAVERVCIATDRLCQL